METKKTPKASLENKRVLFAEVGLILALAAMIGIFSYSTTTRKAPTLQASTAPVEIEELVPITQETPPEPPKVPVIPIFSEVLEIVGNDIDTDFVITCEDTDIEVPIYDYRKEVEETNVEEEEIPMVAVEQKPTFLGGEAKTFSRWVAQHLVYPEIAKETGLKGRVMVQFTIRKNGTVGNIKLLRSVDPILDKEAMRVVGESPRWEPGMQLGRAVNVTYQIPVFFELR